MPMYLTTLFLTGLRYPRLAVGFASVWLVGRVLYTTGEPSHAVQDRHQHKLLVFQSHSD